MSVLTGYGLSDIDPEKDCGAVAILLRMDGVMCCKSTSERQESLVGLKCQNIAKYLLFTRNYGHYDPVCEKHFYQHQSK